MSMSNVIALHIIIFWDVVQDIKKDGSCWIFLYIEQEKIPIFSEIQYDNYIFVIYE